MNFQKILARTGFVGQKDPLGLLPAKEAEKSLVQADAFIKKSTVSDLNVEPDRTHPLLMSRRARYQDAFSQAVCLIGTGPLTSDRLKKSGDILKRLSLGSPLADSAKVWLAINRRLQGFDTKQFFYDRFASEPSNRFYLVNFAASCITSHDIEKIYWPKALQYLRVHIKIHPRDYFARYLEALMVIKYLFDLGKAVELFEEIYLEKKSYTPATSAMAAIFRDTGRSDAALDYAREAFSRNPHDFQAKYLVSIISKEGDAMELGNHGGLEHVLYPALPSMTEAILYGPYSLQDPFRTRL